MNNGNLADRVCADWVAVNRDSSPHKSAVRNDKGRIAKNEKGLRRFEGRKSVCLGSSYFFLAAFFFVAFFFIGMVMFLLVERSPLILEKL